jgi:hypothetical protein
LFVVDPLLFLTEQTELGSCNLVENLLGLLGVLANVIVANVAHLAIGRRVNYIRVVFEQLNAQ